MRRSASLAPVSRLCTLSFPEPSSSAKIFAASLTVGLSPRNLPTNVPSFRRKTVTREASLLRIRKLPTEKAESKLIGPPPNWTRTPPSEAPEAASSTSKKESWSLGFSFLNASRAAGKTSGGALGRPAMRFPSQNDAIALRIGERDGSVHIVRMAPKFAPSGRVETAKPENDFTAAAEHGKVTARPVVK